MDLILLSVPGEIVLFGDAKLHGLLLILLIQIKVINLNSKLKFSKGPGLRLYTGKISFKNSKNGFALQKGKGSRANKERVNFPNKFSNNPSVICALADLDSSRFDDKFLK